MLNFGNLAFALIGALVGGFFTIWAVRLSHKTAIEVVDRQEFIKASIEFKEAFFDEIKALQDKSMVDKSKRAISANDIIESALEKHTRAFFRFKDFLPPDDRIRFHICWNTYLCKEETEQYQTVFENYFAPKFFTCYKPKSNSVEDEHEARDRALQNISELFKFAEL